MTARVEAAGASEVSPWRGVFLAAALYDLILGAVFFLLWKPIFEALDVTPPDNASYIHVSAAFVFVQGLGYWFVYQNILRNIDIVKIGVVYKAVYVALAVYYLIIGELIDAIFAWFAVFDFVFLVLFLRFLMLAQRWEGQDRRRGEAP